MCTETDNEYLRKCDSFGVIPWHTNCCSLDTKRWSHNQSLFTLFPVLDYKNYSIFLDAVNIN